MGGMPAAETKVHSGGCLCGAIRFAAAGPVINPHSCSCRLCQRHTGALTAAWVEFSSEDVSWIGPDGAPSLYRSSGYSSRAFCAACGSSIGAVDDAPVVALLLGIFDAPDALDLMPTAHSFEDGRPGWWHVEARDEGGRAQADAADAAEA